MKILVTGGSGFIGSHTCLELIQAGFDVVVIDNLCNSSIESLNRVEILADYKIPFYKVDIRDKKAVTRIFKLHQIDGVIHFAGLKAVGDSVKQPLEYYDNNVYGTIVLLEVMRKFDCKMLVFSSSAVVYGDPVKFPIKEDFPLSVISPYGRTKLVIEQLLRDMLSESSDWHIAILRYFNPVGAHKSGLIGEDPNNIPSNLIPYISQVASGKLEKLHIFGGDYDTADGTGVRDYVHVVDLAKGHIKALQAIKKQAGIVTVNLGTGTGYSVLDVVKAFEKVSGKSISYQIVQRREGDIAICYADVSFAADRLGWNAKYKLEQMCEDAWRWQSRNPNGYSGSN